MSTIPVTAVSMTVDEYLAGEPMSEVRHEYLGGVVYGMAGASETHNIIAVNLVGELRNRLRGKPCQVFGSDMKVRIEVLGDTYFYYPDAMIACDPTDGGNPYRRRPLVLFEILSEETRRVDEREKKFVYRQIPTLEAYILIEQGRGEVLLERRVGNEWTQQRLIGLEAVASLPTIGVELPLAELYERVVF